MTKRLIIKLYNESDELLDNKEFVLEDYVRFETMESAFCNNLILINEDLSKIQNSQIKAIHADLMSVDESAVKMDVILKIEDFEIVNHIGIKEVTYSINDNMLKDYLDNGILLESLKFIITPDQGV